jgi:hypothetical protein
VAERDCFAVTRRSLSQYFSALHSLTRVAWQLLRGMDVLRSPISPAALARPEVRCALALYVATAVTAAIVLVARTGTTAGAVVTVVLIPVAACFGVIGAAAANAWLQSLRERRLGASIRRAITSLGRPYRIVSRNAETPGREDHVAIGPNGIFVVIACDDTGRVTASDHRLFVNARQPWRNLVEDARIEALRVGERVRKVVGRPLPVHAVLCFTRALVAVGQELRGVKIVQVPRLARLIASIAAKPVLTEADIDAATAALTITARVGVLRPVFSKRRDQARPVAGRRLKLIASSPSHRGLS